MSPIASIIICTYNRSEKLSRVFDSLLKQKIPRHVTYEVVLVDNNSKDRTRELCREYEPRFSGKLKYIMEATQGKVFALNRGIKVAEGNTLIFTDDDVTLDEHWFNSIMKCFDVTGCDCVGGRVLPIFPDGTPTWVKEHATQLSGAVVIYEYGNQSLPYKKSMYPFIGANYAFKRDVFEEIGDFRIDFDPRIPVGEDSEMVNRVFEKGRSMYYCGQALVWHPFDQNRLTLRHMARWNIILGKSASQSEQEQGRSFICYSGVPRYLFRSAALNFLKLMGSCWNKPKFYVAWRDLFCTLGRIQGYRQKITRISNG